MDKIKLFEEKINNFFIKKAGQLKIDIEKLKLIISFDSKKLNYELWDTANKFHKYQKVDEILNLSFIEKAFVSNEKVEAYLLQTINKYAIENKVEAKEIALMLLPTKEYRVLKYRIKIKDINLNELI